MNAAINVKDIRTRLSESLWKKIKKEIEKREIKDYKIETDIGSNKGDNFLGVIVKISVSGFNKYRDEVNLNWIVKTAPKANALRQIIDVDILYDREIYVYESLLPFFARVQNEKAVLNPFDAYAGYILSHKEPLQESLIMEDMKSMGYVLKDKKKSLDFTHVKLVMEAYGKLHAISFALRDQRPEEFAKIADATSEQMFSMYSSNVDKNHINAHQELRHAKILEAMDPVQDAKAIEVYKLYAQRNIDIILDAIKMQNEYSVIGHGDSWVNNILFKYDDEKESNRPTKVCLLDWQLARYGSPSFDLSYFIFTCTDKELRDKHYDQMIKFYYYSLCKHLIDLGSDPEKLFPFSALQAELKRGSVLGLHLTVMVLHLMLSETDEVPDFDSARDQNEMISEFDYKSVNEKAYQERVRGVVLDFAKNGYFDMVKS